MCLEYLQKQKKKVCSQGYLILSFQRAFSLRRHTIIGGYIISLLLKLFFCVLSHIFLMSLRVRQQIPTNIFLGSLIHFGLSNLTLTSVIRAPADCPVKYLHFIVIAQVQENEERKHYCAKFGDAVLKYTMMILHLLTVGSC